MVYCEIPQKITPLIHNTLTMQQILCPRLVFSESVHDDDDTHVCEHYCDDWVFLRTYAKDRSFAQFRRDIFLQSCVDDGIDYSVGLAVYTETRKRLKARNHELFDAFKATPRQKLFDVAQRANIVHFVSDPPAPWHAIVTQARVLDDGGNEWLVAESPDAFYFAGMEGS
jgi:hypothetical protein